jgi:transcriptional regulator with XRE-family HTH domain
VTGGRIRVLRRHLLDRYIEHLEVSQRSVATRAGISHSTLNHLITGRRETCIEETAQAIEQVLGCPPRPGLQHLHPRLTGPAAHAQPGPASSFRQTGLMWPATMPC